MENVFSGRTAGIPNIVLIGAAALGIWFLFLRGKATTNPTANATSPTGQATTDYSLGYAQGVQANAPPPAQPAAAPNWRATTRAAIPGQPQFTNIPIVGGLTGSPQVGSLSPSSQVSLANASPTPGTWPGLGPVSYYQVALPGGGTGYVLAQDLTDIGTGGGVGGGRAPAGSRSKAPVWHEAHPLVGAPVRYPHYVRAVGGARAHRSEIHRVARQAGIHPARVAMLNPTPTGRIRVA